MAYRFEDRLTGGSLVYAPCVAAWTGPLDTGLAAASCVLLDGTFFHDDEMLHATGQDRPALCDGALADRRLIPALGAPTPRRASCTPTSTTPTPPWPRTH